MTCVNVGTIWRSLQEPLAPPARSKPMHLLNLDSEFFCTTFCIGFKQCYVWLWVSFISQVAASSPSAPSLSFLCSSSVMDAASSKRLSQYGGPFFPSHSNPFSVERWVPLAKPGGLNGNRSPNKQKKRMMREFRGAMQKPITRIPYLI